MRQVDHKLYTDVVHSNKDPYVEWFMQNRHNSFANALELCLSCTIIPNFDNN